MAVKLSQLIFACTPAQLETALVTTLPAAGFTVTRAPIKYTGWVVDNTIQFTGTVTNTSNVITVPSSIAGLVVGQSISGTGIPANTTITILSPLTISANATATNAGVALTATPGGGQIDFSYDGLNFLTFFGANPIPTLQQALVGIPENQIGTPLQAYFISVLAATLGAPVPPNQAVPPPYVP